MVLVTMPYKAPIREGAILTLDLGTKTGWAVRQENGLVVSGTVEFRPGRFEGGGMTFLRFRRWLDEIYLSTGCIGGIWFEEVSRNVATIAAQVYGGFHGQLTAWAEEHGIPYRGVPVGTIKRHATGKGNASKEMVIEAMRLKGHNPCDDNAADALAILHWVLSSEVLP